MEIGDRPRQQRLPVFGEPLFRDRVDAGRQLAKALVDERAPAVVVIGLARGGVEVAAEVARSLGAPLDVVAVRKVGHSWQPEYAIGAVAPGGGVFLRAPDGLTEVEVAEAVEQAKAAAAALDRRLHVRRPPLGLAGKTALLVDDGLATGATMIAAAGWARARRAARVVAAVPVAAVESAALVRRQIEGFVCLHEPADFGAVGLWYETFPQVDDEQVLRLLDDAAVSQTEAEVAVA